MAESNFDADAELYEYDAPSEVVDLKELQDVEGDKWFGEFSFSLQHISWWLLAIVFYWCLWLLLLGRMRHVIRGVFD